MGVSTSPAQPYPSDSLATPNTLALRDGDANFAINNLQRGYATRAVSATLTKASPFINYLTSGVARNYDLPAVSTIPLGFSFLFINDGTATDQIRSSGLNLVTNILPGHRVFVYSIDTTGTDSAAWTFILIPFLDGDPTLAVSQNSPTSNAVVGYIAGYSEGLPNTPTYTDAGGTTGATPGNQWAIRVAAFITLSGHIQVTFTPVAVRTTIQFSLTVPLGAAATDLNGSGAAFNSRDPSSAPVNITEDGAGGALFTLVIDSSHADGTLDIDYVIAYQRQP